MRCHVRARTKTSPRPGRDGHPHLGPIIRCVKGSLDLLKHLPVHGIHGRAINRDRGSMVSDMV